LKFSFRNNVYAIVGIALAVLIIAPRLLFPLQMDQYFHHYLGWRLAEGELPYLGSYDQNFPGGAILHAVCILIFGQTSLGFALFDLILQSIGIYFISRTANRLRGEKAALLAPIVYALTYIGLGVWNIGQRDAFIVPFLAYGVWLLVQERLSAKQLIALGLACGFMILLRPMFVLFAIFAAVYVGWRSNEWRRAFLVLIFGALPALLIILAYVSIGEFRTLYESTVQFNLEVYGKFRHGVSMRGSGTMTLIFAVGLLGLVALAIWDRAKLKAMIPVIVASIIAPISTFIQGQGDAHHMTPSYAMAAIWSAVGLVAILQRLGFHQGGKGRISIAVLTMLIILRGCDRLPWDSINAYAKGASLQSIYASSKSTDVHLAEEFAVAKYLKPKLAPGDFLYIWSMRIWPYQHTGHPSPTRFQTHEHILMQPKGQPLTELQLRWREEMMRDLQTKPPKFILWTTTDNLWLLPNAESSKDQVKRFPKFEHFVNSGYVLDTTIGGFEILRRK
jgi:hypothetical protein